MDPNEIRTVVAQAAQLMVDAEDAASRDYLMWVISLIPERQIVQEVMNVALR